MKRLIKNRSGYPDEIYCAQCGTPIDDISKRRWVPNIYDDKKIVGFCFMDQQGNPVEAFDLCDECIGKLYAKMIF